MKNILLLVIKTCFTLIGSPNEIEILSITERGYGLGRPKGFNRYRVDGEVTTIFLENKEGDITEAYIDTNDLQRLIDLNYCWHKAWYESPQCYFVTATVKYYVNGKRHQKVVLLHRVLLEVSDTKTVIDHEDHNTMNNRKYNLRLATIQDNLKHRETRNKNNRSGYRNVCLIKGKWIVQLQVNGKNTILGEFDYDDLDLAGKFAAEMRKKYYGQFQGNN